MLMLAGAEWSLASAFEYAAVGLSSKILFSQIEYIGALTVPVLYLVFCFEYNRLDDWLTVRRIALLYVVPVVCFCLALTNSWHGLIWTNFTWSPAGHNILVYHHGIVYYIGVMGYSYICLFVGTALLVWSAFRFHAPYRRQTSTLIVGSIVPWALDAVYNAGLVPIPGLEVTPIALCFTGVSFAIGIFFFGLLDLTPVARETLIEKMSEGVLVLDRQNRVVDINPAALRLIGRSSPTAEKVRPGDVLDDWPALLDSISGVLETSTEIEVDRPYRRFLEVNVSPIRSRHGELTGRLIVLRDITSRKTAEEEVQRINLELRERISEIETLQAELQEQAIRDALTGLYNRRYMDERLEAELVRAVRDGTNASIVMLDIDHFKSLNDTYGHKAGDEVLRAFAKLLSTQIRQYDIAFRYGGEEFLVVMPNTSGLVAMGRAEEWRETFARIVIDYGADRIRATMSAGVATFPDQGRTLDEVLQAGDRALYEAKAYGRNRVHVAPPSYVASDPGI
jgi:diguanylate cyclase (GGDEF)-like protein/PAS domain S-box-containing protein